MIWGIITASTYNYPGRWNGTAIQELDSKQIQETLLTSLHRTGNRQEANPPHSQAAARYRRGLPRRDQRAPITASGSTSSGTTRGHKGRQGEEDCGGEQEEDGEGEDCGWGSKRTDGPDSEQAGREGSTEQGHGEESVRVYGG